jgi:hypothetical protein
MVVINKLIEVGIDVQNCIGLYTDPNNIIQIARNRYVGRCFRSCYILNIENIKRQSECVINQDGPPSFGTLSIICEVRAIIYGIGEIINGCKVINKNQNGILICETDNTSIILAPHPMFKSIIEGQLISVRVVAVRYSNGADKISVSATPYLPDKVNTVYKIGPVMPDMGDLFADILSKIKYEESEMIRLKTEKKKAWDTFDQLLYAYNDDQKPAAGAKVLNIKEIINGGWGQYVSRDPKIRLSTPDIYSYDTRDAIPPDAIIVADLTTPNVIIMMLDSYLSHLRTIREMINIYSTEELIISHTNIWLIFKKSK